MEQTDSTHSFVTIRQMTTFESKGAEKNQIAVAYNRPDMKEIEAILKADHYELVDLSPVSLYQVEAKAETSAVFMIFKVRKTN